MSTDPQHLAQAPTISMPMPNILITEDEALPRKELKKAFTKRGFSVFEAGDSSEALRQVVSKNIDVVLMDILLGDGPDGIEAARRIQEIRSDVFFIFISGVIKDDPSYLERIEHAQNEGLRVIDSFEKPVLGALPQIFEKIKGLDLTNRKAEEDPMALAASIDAVYDEMRTLVEDHGSQTGLREMLRPLRERLRTLQEEEARQIGERYDAHFRPAYEQAKEAITHARQLLRTK